MHRSNEFLESVSTYSMRTLLLAIKPSKRFWIAASSKSPARLLTRAFLPSFRNPKRPSCVEATAPCGWFLLDGRKASADALKRRQSARTAEAAEYVEIFMVNVILCSQGKQSWILEQQASLCSGWRELSPRANSEKLPHFLRHSLFSDDFHYCCRLCEFHGEVKRERQCYNRPLYILPANSHSIPLLHHD